MIKRKVLDTGPPGVWSMGPGRPLWKTRAAPTSHTTRLHPCKEPFRKSFCFVVLEDILYFTIQNKANIVQGSGCDRFSLLYPLNRIS